MSLEDVKLKLMYDNCKKHEETIKEQAQRAVERSRIIEKKDYLISKLKFDIQSRNISLGLIGRFRRWLGI